MTCPPTSNPCQFLKASICSLIKVSESGNNSVLQTATFLLVRVGRETINFLQFEINRAIQAEVQNHTRQAIKCHSNQRAVKEQGTNDQPTYLKHGKNRL